MRIHYFQHVAFENPGSVLSWAERGGHSLSATRFFDGAIPPDASSYDWLFVMGGPMNVYEEGIYPWIAAEKDAIRKAIASGKAVIGVCLGAQLIADVIGGAVTRNPVAEIGWHSITMTDTARDSPLFAHVPEKATVFQWHGDTFSVLPPEAVLLARGEACAHQAFMYRDRVFGFQFHLESTKGTIERLIENCGEEIVQAEYVQSAEYMLSRASRAKAGNEWMDVFLTSLEQRLAGGSQPCIR